MPIETILDLLPNRLEPDGPRSFREIDVHVFPWKTKMIEPRRRFTGSAATRKLSDVSLKQDIESDLATFIRALNKRGAPIMKVSSGAVNGLTADLRKALVASPKALAAWDGITPLARNEWICWTIESRG